MKVWNCCDWYSLWKWIIIGISEVYRQTNHPLTKRLRLSCFIISTVGALTRPPLMGVLIPNPTIPSTCRSTYSATSILRWYC